MKENFFSVFSSFVLRSAETREQSCFSWKKRNVGKVWALSGPEIFGSSKPNARGHKMKGMCKERKMWSSENQDVVLIGTDFVGWLLFGSVFFFC